MAYVTISYWATGYTVGDETGDVAFRSHGTRKKLWETKAEEWLAERYGAAVEVAKKPEKAQNRFVADFLQQVETVLPEWSLQINDPTAGLMDRLKSPAPDLQALAQAIEAHRMKLRRKRRDEEALMLLV